MIIESKSNLSKAGVAVLVSLVAACGFVHGSTDADSATTPTVVSNIPSDGAIGVALDGTISATFSEAMDPTTLTVSSFTLTSGTTVVQGMVTYADSTAVFSPAEALTSDGVYLATISIAAISESGVALAVEHTWSFTGNHVAGGARVELGTAVNYAVLAKASISGTGATVTGNLGISPAAASYITGFSLVAPPTDFSTSAQVTGKVYASDYAAPTPANLITAVLDMERAFTEAAERTPDFIDWNAGNINGMTLAPGVYRWTGDLNIAGSVTLTGSAADVWIFQIAGTLDMAANADIVLMAGALPKHVFWQTSGAVTLGANAQLEGVVLTATAFTSGAGTLIKGRVLSQTDVTITNSTVFAP